LAASGYLSVPDPRPRAGSPPGVPDPRHSPGPGALGGGEVAVRRPLRGLGRGVDEEGPDRCGNRAAGVSWDEAAGIPARAVGRGLARRPAMPVRHLGIDGTSFARRW